MIRNCPDKAWTEGRGIGGGSVIATFWPNKEMGRNQDGLGEYTCNVLLDRPCAWICAKLPVYLYNMVEFDSV
jgi:hypothetical protein